MTKDERKQAANALSFPGESGPDVYMAGVRIRSDADGYYLMLIEVDLTKHPHVVGRRFTVNITPEHYEEMLDEWVHGPKDERPLEASGRTEGP